MVITRYRDINHELDNDSTNMPATTNQPYDKTPCQSAYGTHPMLVPYCYLNLTTVAPIRL